ncbi:TauD/TfdA family dioxygenase [Verticiella sediminum]|uniref:TauD/TfdA family dioxygenase n=1 Tax=Verticiella sediminum TaxID=1247510 RepID=A0A556AJN1_9BURK|nr:TauD/TfdA family dioxygenase [Verticiella sediminum]TSH93065.1 TauD/TfdA family dioxygenase [Verticiella sediminum]
MRIEPLDAPLGCEVLDADLSRPLDEGDIAAIRQAFLEHGVLIARGQELAEPELIRFARSFGPQEPYESTLKDYLQPGHPELLVLSNIVENGRRLGVQDGGQYWHTDRSYVERPAWSSVLHAKCVPSDAHGNPLGDTLFSSSVVAFAALSAGERARLRTLRARHEYVFRFSRPNDSMPAVDHPVVLRHPLTGAECLYVNAGFTKEIPGLPPEESRQLLESLYEHAARPEFVYRHRWQPGDVLMWDNYSTQHKAVGNYGEIPRLMWRATIQGFALH